MRLAHPNNNSNSNQYYTATAHRQHYSRRSLMLTLVLTILVGCVAPSRQDKAFGRTDIEFWGDQPFDSWNAARITDGYYGYRDIQDQHGYIQESFMRMDQNFDPGTSLMPPVDCPYGFLIDLGRVVNIRSIYVVFRDTEEVAFSIIDAQPGTIVYQTDVADSNIQSTSIDVSSSGIFEVEFSAQKVGLCFYNTVDENSNDNIRVTSFQVYEQQVVYQFASTYTNEGCYDIWTSSNCQSLLEWPGSILTLPFAEAATVDTLLIFTSEWSTGEATNWWVGGFTLKLFDTAKKADCSWSGSSVSLVDSNGISVTAYTQPEYDCTPATETVNELRIDFTDTTTGIDKFKVHNLVVLGTVGSTTPDSCTGYSYNRDTDLSEFIYDGINELSYRTYSLVLDIDYEPFPATCSLTADPALFTVTADENQLLSVRGVSGSTVLDTLTWSIDHFFLDAGTMQCEASYEYMGTVDFTDSSMTPEQIVIFSITMSPDVQDLCYGYGTQAQPYQYTATSEKTSQHKGEVETPQTTTGPLQAQLDYVFQTFTITLEITDNMSNAYATTCGKHWPDSSSACCHITPKLVFIDGPVPVEYFDLVITEVQECGSNSDESLVSRWELTISLDQPMNMFPNHDSDVTFQLQIETDFQEINVSINNCEVGTTTLEPIKFSDGTVLPDDYSISIAPGTDYTIELQKPEYSTDMWHIETCWPGRLDQNWFTKFTGRSDGYKNHIYSFNRQTGDFSIKWAEVDDEIKQIVELCEFRLEYTIRQGFNKYSGLGQLRSQDQNFIINYLSEACNDAVLDDSLDLSVTDISFADFSDPVHVVELTLPYDTKSADRVATGIAGCEACDYTLTVEILDAQGNDLDADSSSPHYDEATQQITVSPTLVTEDTTTIYIVKVTMTHSPTSTAFGIDVEPKYIEFSVTNLAPVTEQILPQIFIEPATVYYVTQGADLSLNFQIQDENGDDFDVSVSWGTELDDIATCDSFEPDEEEEGLIIVECTVSPGVDFDLGMYDCVLTIEQEPDFSDSYDFSIVVEEAVPETETAEETDEEITEDETETEDDSYDGTEDGEFTQEVIDFTFLESLFEQGLEPPLIQEDTFREPFRITSSEMSENGLVTIQYNQPIDTVTEAINLKYYQNSDKDEILYTFNVTSVETTQIQLQVEFERPLIVSVGFVKDSLDIYLPVILPASESEGRRLQEVTFVKVTFPALPQQVASQEEFESLTTMASSAGSFASSLFWVFLVSSIAMKGIMGQLWGTFQALQLINVFSLFMVSVPANLLMIQAGFNTILNMDFIDKQYLYDKSVGKVVPAPQDPAKESSTESKLGFGITNLIVFLPLGLCVIMLFVWSVTTMWVFYSFIYPRLKRSHKDIFMKIKGKLMWNSLIRTVIQSYLAFLLTAVIAFRKFAHDKQFGFQGLLMFMMLFFLMAWPFITRRIVKAYRGKLDEKKVKYSVGTLYINQDISKPKTCENYHTWFFLRRWTVVLTIVFFTAQAPSIQIAITGMISVAVMCYLVAVQPFQHTRQNLMALINEAAVYVACQCMILFSEIVSEPEVQYEHGYHFLIGLGIFCFVVLNGLVVDLVQPIIEAARKFKLKRQRKKKVKERLELFEKRLKNPDLDMTAKRPIKVPVIQPVSNRKSDLSSSDRNDRQQKDAFTKFATPQDMVIAAFFDDASATLPPPQTPQAQQPQPQKSAQPESSSSNSSSSSESINLSEFDANKEQMAFAELSTPADQLLAAYFDPVAHPVPDLSQTFRAAAVNYGSKILDRNLTHSEQQRELSEVSREVAQILAESPSETSSSGSGSYYSDSESPHSNGDVTSEQQKNNGDSSTTKSQSNGQVTSKKKDW